MWRRVFRVLALALALAPVAPASDSSTVVALWSFDEREGRRTAADVGPDGLHGEVGADVGTGVVSEGAIAYRFPDVAPNSPPVRPGHLVTVPDTDRLDPGDSRFAVTVRFRTTTAPSNIVQKGQRPADGGYWKVEQDDGIARCMFMDSSGRGVSASSTGRIDDGRWHTVHCVRTPSEVTLSVDGGKPVRVAGTTGPIANGWPMTVGGKPRCDQKWVGCDYFSGDVDLVRIEKE